MLMTLIDTWLATRRASGFALRKYERHLRRFAEFAAARGEDHVRAETALAWASHAATPGQRCRHFQRVVQLARYLHAEDPRHEIPRIATSRESGIDRFRTSTPRTKRAGSSRSQRGSGQQSRSGRSP
jgi:integrase/recombinase XerD